MKIDAKKFIVCSAYLLAINETPIEQLDFSDFFENLTEKDRSDFVFSGLLNTDLITSNFAESRFIQRKFDVMKAIEQLISQMKFIDEYERTIKQRDNYFEGQRNTVIDGGALPVDERTDSIGSSDNAIQHGENIFPPRQS